MAELDLATRKALAIATGIGLQLSVASTPFFVAGLAPVRKLDPRFIERVAESLGLGTIPAEAALIDQWYEAICKDDDEAAGRIETSIDAAGLHAEAIAAVRAIDHFYRAAAQLLAVPAPATRIVH
jgi:hypothetical protein